MAIRTNGLVLRRGVAKDTKGWMRVSCVAGLEERFA